VAPLDSTTHAAFQWFGINVDVLNMQTKKSWIDLSAGAGTGGGMQGMHPPPSDLKRY